MIGIYGGTFDPIHFGHLRTALDLCQRLELEAVRMIPAHVPPHRPAPVEARWAMLQAAIAGEPDLVADDRELRRPGPSYMVDTLTSLRSELGDRPMGLILGMDAFLGLERWHRWERILDLAHLLVMERPGAERSLDGPLLDLVSGVEEEDPALLETSAAGRIAFVPVRQLEISATEIRELLNRGQSPGYLLPAAVLKLIRERGWYGARELPLPT